MFNQKLILMEVNTQAVNFNAKPQLLEFIQRRMNKLEQFYDKVIQTDVYLKVENTNKCDRIHAEPPKTFLVMYMTCI